MIMILRIERGWAGHFICADRCMFRRNTLILSNIEGKDSIVVSTIGGMRLLDGDGLDTIGAGGRYYETMAFKAIKEGPYWEADVSEEISFDSEWAICADHYSMLPEDVDNKANQMHEIVVKELMDKMK